ncbi:MAG: 23S rRNA (adenine(2503)-C(2))-methyltransferase RlmN [Candidatus Dormiibacterota bacterium]
MSIPELCTVSEAEVVDTLARLGEPSWRARQIQAAVWQPFVTGFGTIQQLPARLRDALPHELRFSTVSVDVEALADAGMTIKLLCRLADGQTVETVAMETPARDGSRRRSTVCVSSQVGCAVGCPFCATGHMGLRRNCTAAEIVDQVRAAASALHRRGLGPVTHIVYMGMGEPLANVTATLGSLAVLTRDAGISARRITVSTSGVAPGIEQLAASGIPVTLAVSLHAATDELRDRLVPINKTYPLGVVLGTASRYAEQTGRRLSFEWCLIGGVNDSIDQAEGLRDLARRAQAHINVIPMNRIEGSPWGPPDPAVARRFLGALRGARVTVRDTRGGDADAACGQLRADLEARRILRPDGTLSPPRVPARV